MLVKLLHVDGCERRCRGWVAHVACLTKNAGAHARSLNNLVQKSWRPLRDYYTFSRFCECRMPDLRQYGEDTKGEEARYECLYLRAICTNTLQIYPSTLAPRNEVHLQRQRISMLSLQPTRLSISHGFTTPRMLASQRRRNRSSSLASNAYGSRGLWRTRREISAS